MRICRYNPFASLSKGVETHAAGFKFYLCQREDELCANALIMISLHHRSFERLDHAEKAPPKLQVLFTFIGIHRAQIIIVSCLFGISIYLVGTYS